MTKILFFGALTDITSVDALTLADFTDVDTAKAELVRRFPALAERQFAIAVNGVLVKENMALPAGGTIALLPPFSGG